MRYFSGTLSVLRKDKYFATFKVKLVFTNQYWANLPTINSVIIQTHSVSYPHGMASICKQQEFSVEKPQNCFHLRAMQYVGILGVSVFIFCLNDLGLICSILTEDVKYWRKSYF